jgi:type IV secretory pathway VirB3-like protein
MEPSVVVLGLTRQAQIWGLPMPYLLVAAALTILPFFLFKALWWLLSGPLWYLAARAITAINPNAHVVLVVVLTRTPMALLKRARSRRYV